MRRRRVGGFLVVAMSFTMAARAATATVDVPLKNWAAPSTWTPTAGVPKGGVKAALVTTLFNPLPFVPLTPCRVVDTRLGSGFPAGYGPPALAALATRVFTIGGQCGIPTTAQAVSFQFTAVNMTANGNFRAWPDGVSMPTASVLNWTATTGVIGNGIVVPVGGVPGALDIYLNGPVSSTVDLVLDVNGYYSADVSSSSSGTFSITSSGYGSTAIYGHSTGTYGYGVKGNGYYGVFGHGTYGVYGTGNYGVLGSGSWSGVSGTSTAGHGVEGTTTVPGGYGVVGINYSTGTGIHGESTGIGVEGYSAGTSGVMRGVDGITASSIVGAAGVRGVDGSGAPPGWDLLYPAGIAGVSRFGAGVLAVTQFGGGVALWAARLNDVSPYEPTSEAFLASAGAWAAAFYGSVNIYNHTWSTGSNSGDLSVQGTVSKGGGSFKIDHPLDPENMYLYHSFVESPDMMNVYNGVVELGADGSVVVKLPHYFEALNRDFRYQLTALGMAQPDLHVALEIAGNEFVVAGGKPHARVSWQVTGVRKDPFANEHRIVPEVEKEAGMKGLYLHAREYKQSPEKSISAKAREIEHAREQSEMERRDTGQRQRN